MRIYHVLIVFFYLFVQAQIAAASDARDRSEDIKILISKTIVAYGGEKVVEELTGFHAVGDINAFMRQDHGSYEISFMRSRKLRVDTKYQRSFETRILNGNSGYRGTDAVPLAQVRDHRYLAMVYQYKHSDMLYGLLKGYYSVTWKGQEAYNGSTVAVMHLIDREGPPMDVYIDAKTYYIVKVTGHFIVGDGRATTLSSEFSDFKKVADTVFPFKVANYAGGQKIAETIMKSYSINPAIPDTVFAP